MDSLGSRLGLYQADHLDAACVKLILELCKGTQFCRAHWGKVGGVREENGPAVADEVMEVNVAVSRLCLEIRS